MLHEVVPRPPDGVRFAAVAVVSLREDQQVEILVVLDQRLNEKQGGIGVDVVVEGTPAFSYPCLACL